MAIEDLIMWLLAPSLLAVSIVLIILGRRKNNRTFVLIGSVVGIGGICFIALLVYLIYLVTTYG